MDPVPFLPDDLVRYARHLSLAEVGLPGQRKLREARVLLIGAGGLGSPAALYLAAAGVGTLGVVDDDLVDLTNLQRQVLHGTSDLGRAKVDSAAERLHELNPGVRVERYQTRLTAGNALELFRDFQVVVDGSDNFPTRYLVNDAAVLAGRPVVYGSILRFEGQVSVFGLPGGPCYRCLHPEPPAAALIPSCAEAGVLGVVPGIIGSLQALEALKLLLGVGSPLAGRLLHLDGLAMRWQELVVERDPACVVCGDRPEQRELIDYAAFCGLAPAAPTSAEIAAAELAERLRGGQEVVLLDVREPWEWEIARIPGSVLVPLSSLEDSVGGLPAGGLVVTICHHGIRSLRARELLLERGVNQVLSLAGGVDGWAAAVDPNLARY
ncbi:MAG: molybdopterin biosynthesis protein MoeB [Gemmatimonadetes bacterium]|nr:molybdopterin biosynthesis protein MoeB [Gemmatimonadota bacterium]